MPPKIEVFLETEADNGGKTSLGLDGQGNLYVNDKKVVTESKLKLDGLVNASIVITALATLAVAIVEVLRFMQGR